MTDEATRAAVTRSTHTIHNPDDARHFMRIKPANRHVRILRDGELLAESDSALRVIEAGNDLYDPILYLPRSDIRATLAKADKARTWCPLKGHATYFDLVDAGGDIAVREIAWTYDETLDFAAELQDLIGFYGDKVTLEESPLA